MRACPQELRLLIGGGHTVATKWFQGWSGLKNGSLLEAAEQAGFDLFLTADQELIYQQNRSGRKIAILVLSTNNWELVKANVARIVAAIGTTTPGSYGEVQISQT